MIRNNYNCFKQCLLLLGVSVFLVGVIPCLAGPVKKDDTKFVEDLKKSALAGDVGAQYRLGLFYEEGSDKQPSHLPSAAKWYEKAAAQGYPLALNRFAVLCFHGLGDVKKDQARAKDLLEQSAAQGDSVAMFMLGKILLAGADGVEKDSKKGTDLIFSAANKGNANAQDDLGVMFYNGTDVIERDRGRAFMWYKNAALQDFPPAQLHLGSMYYYGISPVEKDIEMGVEWVEKAAKLGSQEAFDLLVQWSDGKTKSKEVILEMKKGNTNDGKGKK